MLIIFTLKLQKVKQASLEFFVSLLARKHLSFLMWQEYKPNGEGGSDSEETKAQEYIFVFLQTVIPHILSSVYSCH